MEERHRAEQRLSSPEGEYIEPDKAAEPEKDENPATLKDTGDGRPLRKRGGLRGDHGRRRRLQLAELAWFGMGWVGLE